MIPKNEIDWYYNKEADLTIYKYKLQPVKEKPFWKCNPLHAIEPLELVKLVGRPKLMSYVPEDDDEDPSVTDLEFSLKLRATLDNLLTILARSCKLKQAFKTKIAKRMKGKT
ncbi:hypothetical protein MTR67_040472 [Solanum verrucosum]|uniref:Uncharacterized protein n=1 Tax=Solanum verrucosum TaxID=315347 RepID=A0AAF0ZPG2_SOLVR|nr:hypothetical protein MTR67_040472 [Solanum verrucosum]